MKKPGYKTSEFWFTLVSFIFSGLYLVGLIGDVSQKEDLIRDVSHGVESIILIGGQLMILYRYISSRAAIKQEEAFLEHTVPVTTDNIQKDNKESKATNKKNNTKKRSTSTKQKGSTDARNKRTNKSRSRKTNKPS